MNLILFTFIVLLGFTSYYFGRKKAYTIQSTKKRLTALPQFYGYYLAIWCAIPAFIIFSLWAIFEPTIVKLLILSDYSNQGYLDDELNLIYEKTKALSRGQFTGEIKDAISSCSRSFSGLLGFGNLIYTSLILAIVHNNLDDQGRHFKKVYQIFVLLKVTPRRGLQKSAINTSG